MILVPLVWPLETAGSGILLPFDLKFQNVRLLYIPREESRSREKEFIFHRKPQQGRAQCCLCRPQSWEAGGDVHAGFLPSCTVRTSEQDPAGIRGWLLGYQARVGHRAKCGSGAPPVFPLSLFNWLPLGS